MIHHFETNKILILAISTIQPQFPYIPPLIIIIFSRLVNFQLNTSPINRPSVTSSARNHLPYKYQTKFISIHVYKIMEFVNLVRRLILLKLKISTF